MAILKYEVVKDKFNEIRTHNKQWSSRDLFDNYDFDQSFHNAELLKPFDTLEEAIEYFNQEKAYCTTEWWKGYGVAEGIHYDYLAIMEVEYSDDGEYVAGYCYRWYIAPPNWNKEENNANN